MHQTRHIGLEQGWACSYGDIILYVSGNQNENVEYVVRLHSVNPTVSVMILVLLIASGAPYQKLYSCAKILSNMRICYDASGKATGLAFGCSGRSGHGKLLLEIMLAPAGIGILLWTQAQTKKRCPKSFYFFTSCFWSSFCILCRYLS